MIDLKLLQKDFDSIALKLKKKGTKAELLKELKIKNIELKTAKINFEKLQSMQNAMSKEFGIYKREGKDITALKAQVDENKIHITDALNIQRLKQKELEELAMAIPNIPDEDVPFGIDEHDNIEIKKILTPKIFNFKPKEHWELAEQNNWIDFKRGVKISKSRFSIIQDKGAKLERALINFMLDFNQKNGFDEISVPEIVNKTALEGTGQLPKFADDLYKIDGEELYLIPTAEVPLTNLFQDEIIEADKLPIQITAQTSCFRKEAGSAGRDVRGIIRQHQFKKVELVTLSKPQESDAIFEKMVTCASNMLLELGLAHRQVLLCCGDLGFSAAKTIDLEVWLPGQNTYREISSISNTRDFQARRAKIRYKDKNKNHFVHTLNGSSLAVGRTMVAIMENYQNEDGSITIPNALKAYIS